MKVWKILNTKKGNQKIACYVKVECDIEDDGYKSLQLARKEIDKSLCATQLLDEKMGEKIIKDIPILVLTN